ncbi:FtsH protease activity modulator HflK [Thioalkalivibrio sulfidiphilus]|uniref:FtsH protease activity modulator HflK n=1 Tax=Thioalkalivibrio sulfidiphilus TaxID=1033854 RepID=UPI0003658C1F|nr:FtsH protease activity modulator HflK [Thioalkalivibrio sulfidiphilus]
MPWNEPGKNSNDPWSGGGRSGGGGGGGQSGPPDLDEVLRKLTRQLNGIFGGGGGSGGGDGGGMGRHASAGISLILIVALVVWLASGFYIISEGERGVVLRFGSFQSVSQPGPNWHLPYPIETVERVDIDSIRSIQHRALMLTADENIIDVDVAVQYRVMDPVDFLFNVRDPDRTTRQVMESAIRERVGKNNLEFILGEGRGEIATSARTVIQEALDAYGAGVTVTTVSMQQAQPPEPVQEAFADAIRAREDEARFRNEAEAYANAIVPQARGEAARIREEAQAYREQVIARAEGDASRFSQLLVEYQRAPDVTRQRLYLETAEAVLGGTNKVIVDMQGGNNLMYLPLDKFMQSQGATTTAPRVIDQRGVDSSRPAPLPSLGTRPDPRAREVR